METNIVVIPDIEPATSNHKIASARGRPKGKGRRGLKKWQPSRWKPLYDEVVALHCANKSNLEIAHRKGITAQQVSNILTCDQGMIAKSKIYIALRQKLGDTLDERVKSIIDKTVSRTQEVLDNASLFEKAPLSVIRIGLSVGRSTGHLRANASKDGPDNSNSGNTTINNNSLTILGSANIEQLMHAIKSSDEARRLNSGTGSK